MIEIEKVISRDIPLINIYAWHLGYTKGMREWLGWAYSDSLFYFHNGSVDVMRPPKEHLEDFKTEVLNRLSIDRDWMKKEYKKFIILIKEIYKFYDKYENEIVSSTNKEIKSAYEKYAFYIEKIMGPYITMIWLPIWLESDTLLADKYSQDIKLALDARKKSEQIFPRGDSFIEEVLKIISKNLLLENKLNRFLSAKELIGYLSNNLAPNFSMLEERAGGFLYSKDGITLAGKTKNIINVFAKLGYRYEVIDYSGVTEIKGNPACRGIVIGRVALIMSKDKISNIKEGEILVTSMTTPEYLPAMKKAAAFVTDEGGITCHAAIVAREMKKPCIIGTKYSTIVLKNGDKVEVNADNGVVKIIERS